MKKIILLGFLTLQAGSLMAADAVPKDEVIAAAKKLGEQANYSWKETVVVPESSQFKPGPTEGKLKKGGVTYFTLSFGDDVTKIYLKGDKSAVSGPDGGWQSAKDMEGDDGPGRFISFVVREFKPPAAQAAELAGVAADLKQTGDEYSSELTEAGAKAQFRFGTPTNPKGSVKFWIKDGQLAKYEFKLTAQVDFNGNDVDIDRDTTVEITNVSATKIEVPAEALKLLEPAPAAAPPASPAAK